MDLNEGPIDCYVRAVLGAALLALPFLGVRPALGYFGVLLLVTGAAGVCPLYSALGWTTRSADTG